MSIVQDLQALPQAFEDALSHLMGTHSAVYDATRELNYVKVKLEMERAQLLLNGVEGRNAEQREAHIKLTLSDYYEELLRCEAELARTRLHADLARYEWDSLRYRLRVLEALRGTPDETVPRRI
jgi:hypothetical protein